MSVETTNATSQYLTFRLGDEIFALEIFKVREVLEYRSVTRVPRTPPFMRGVINLRGSVVPVVDLHMKFGTGETQKTVDTCIIIAEVVFDDETMLLGALADSVEEVFDMDAGMIEPPPRMGTHLNIDFIKGMGKKEEEFVIILDVDRVFSNDEIAAVLDSSSRTSGHKAEAADGGPANDNA